MKCKITHLGVLRENGLAPATIDDAKIIKGCLDDGIGVYYESNTLEVFDEKEDYIGDLESSLKRN